ncbi:aspartyl-phosphate phosphatase Spo0E family protein [Aliibacillus thermotolerans]|uniref:Aspartyl-phosphate phosphatase Spo0E family protein n=1 Tax=Aliibacillus thermotolerans TaxID=1834418 RepID=A0ABW0U963_9BACI|nr:aspartyl-phosphate phosphatase Spo0E family protein [Aliibacillus thermotolerans]MDA3130472.1 Spo0E family sporulation regulatory protein-aspartic acid phosphatase [Aliibacillus thermotolerans]
MGIRSRNLSKKGVFTLRHLELEIEKLRTEMEKMITKKGVGDPDTIKISQKLDQVLNKYELEKRKK